MKESKIQKDAFGLLGVHGYLGLPIEYRGRRGAPDIMILSVNHPKTIAFAELKTKKGKLSEIQEQNIKMLKWWGHEVGVCRTPEEVVEHARKVFYGQTADETTEEKTTPNRLLQAKNRP